MSVASLPEGMTLGRSRLKVSFRTVEELAQNLMVMARILDQDPDAIIEAFQPKPPPEEGAVDDIQTMFQELDDLEAQTLTGTVRP